MSRAKMPTDCRANSKIYTSPLRSMLAQPNSNPSGTSLVLNLQMEQTFLGDTERESHSSHIGLGRSKPQSKAGQVSRAIKTPL